MKNKNILLQLFLPTYCQLCHSHKTFLKTKKHPYRYQCSTCRTSFTITKNTIFYRIKKKSEIAVCNILYVHFHRNLFTVSSYKSLAEKLHIDVRTVMQTLRKLSLVNNHDEINLYINIIDYMHINNLIAEGIKCCIIKN